MDLMPKPFPSNPRLSATHVETGPDGAVFSVRVDLNDPSDALDVQRTYGLVSALKHKPAERRQDGRARTQ